SVQDGLLGALGAGVRDGCNRQQQNAEGRGTYGSARKAQALAPCEVCRSRLGEPGICTEGGSGVAPLKLPLANRAPNAKNPSCERVPEAFSPMRKPTRRKSGRAQGGSTPGDGV